MADLERRARVLEADATRAEGALVVDQLPAQCVVEANVVAVRECRPPVAYMPSKVADISLSASANRFTARDGMVLGHKILRRPEDEHRLLLGSVASHAPV
jgi:hypothetical protein